MSGLQIMANHDHPDLSSTENFRRSKGPTQALEIKEANTTSISKVIMNKDRKKERGILSPLIKLIQVLSLPICTESDYVKALC